jgi:hypothetical protein
MTVFGLLALSNFACFLPQHFYAACVGELRIDSGLFGRVILELYLLVVDIGEAV